MSRLVDRVRGRRDTATRGDGVLGGRRETAAYDSGRGREGGGPLEGEPQPGQSGGWGDMSWTAPVIQR